MKHVLAAVALLLPLSAHATMKPTDTVYPTPNGWTTVPPVQTPAVTPPAAPSTPAITNAPQGGQGGQGGVGGQGGQGGMSSSAAKAAAAARASAVARGGQGGVGQGGSVVNNVSAGNGSAPNHYSAYAPAVLAPALTTSNDTCAGSITGGGSGSPFGFILGGTWAMKGCEIRAVSRQAIALGRQDVAMRVMCQDSKWKEADPSCDAAPVATPVAATPQPAFTSDLRPSPQDCVAMRTISRGWTQAQREYYRNGCG